MTSNKLVARLATFAALYVICAGFAIAPVYAGNNKKNPSGSAPGDLWQQVVEREPAVKGRRLIAPERYLVFRVDQRFLRDILASAPLEFTDAARNTEIIFEVPTPDGTFERFRLEESPVLAPKVAAQFPAWKTFSGQGIDDPTAMARFDINANGFHGYVSGSKGTYLVNPNSEFDRDNYIVYYKSDLTRNDAFSCGVDDGNGFDLNLENGQPAIATPEFSNGQNLRTMRLAVAATKEYTNFYSGNTTTAFAGITTSVNRMNLIYRRELAVTFQLISNTSTVYTTANDGGFPDASNPMVAELSLARAQVVLDAAYGDANYDIGHAVSRTGNPNGLAVSPSICSTGNKAQGFTGSQTPQGDGYDVDYLAHEIGHQFGMSHTFNNNTDGSCTTRSATSAFEPASGVTIMGYGGICAPRNLSANSIEFFHARSLEQSLAEMATNPPSPGGTCGTSANISNTPPTVSAGSNFTIPRLTPFILTGSATDGTNNGLTYAWEEYDLGNPTSSTGDPDTDANAARPIFRSYNPSTSPSRTFPSLTYILNNANTPPSTYMTLLPNAPTSGSTNGYNCASGENCITGESLPSIARVMNFRLTVRDNFAAGGGIADATMQVTVAAATGPFQVTVQNSSPAVWAGNSTQTVTWDVAGSAAAPISAANVKISLSTDGGQTFPTVVLASTANDGTEQITVPNTATTQARIKVEAVGNIFFDINNTNFEITAGGTPTPTATPTATPTSTATATPTPSTLRSRADFDADGKTDLSVFRPSDATWYLDRSTAGSSQTHFGLTGDTPVPGDYDNDGRTDLAVFRPNADNVTPDFYVFNSGTSTVTYGVWGNPGDKAIPGDFDGDGKADFAVFRPSDSTWYILKSTGGFTNSQFGTTGDVAMGMDSDADGKTNLAVFRPSNQTWYIARATGVPAQSFDATQFGLSTDILVPADYDGDRKDDIAVFRPSTGTWWINRSMLGLTAVQFGTNGDVPVPGDYDADGKYDVAVFRSGTWFVNRSTAGLFQKDFGSGSDRAIPRDYLP